MNRVGNQEVHRRAGIETELAGRVNQTAMRLFGHVERMDECRKCFSVGCKFSASTQQT